MAVTRSQLKDTSNTVQNARPFAKRVDAFIMAQRSIQTLKQAIKAIFMKRKLFLK